MKRHLKVLIAGAMMIGAFFFGAFALSSNVYAEEVNNTESNTTEVVEQEQKPETTESTSNEVADTTNDEEIKEDGQFVKWLKSLNMDDFRAWIIALFSYLGINFGLVVSMLIYFVRNKIREAKENKYYTDLISQLDAKHQKEIEDLMASFDEKLGELNTNVIDVIKKQNSEKREIAKNNVDEMRAALGEIKVNLDE